MHSIGRLISRSIVLNFVSEFKPGFSTSSSAAASRRQVVIHSVADNYASTIKSAYSPPATDAHASASEELYIPPKGHKAGFSLGTL